MNTTTYKRGNFEIEYMGPFRFSITATLGFALAMLLIPIVFVGGEQGIMWGDRVKESFGWEKFFFSSSYFICITVFFTVVYFYSKWRKSKGKPIPMTDEEDDGKHNFTMFAVWTYALVFLLIEAYYLVFNFSNMNHFSAIFFFFAVPSAMFVIPYNLYKAYYS